MSDPISIIALIISSSVSAIYAIKKIFKKIKKSKCNMQIETNDGDLHKINIDLSKSIKNLSSILEKIKVETIENNKENNEDLTDNN